MCECKKTVSEADAEAVALLTCLPSTVHAVVYCWPCRTRWCIQYSQHGYATTCSTHPRCMLLFYGFLLSVSMLSFVFICNSHFWHYR